MPHSDEAAEFDQVLKDELESIRARRGQADALHPNATDSQYTKALKHDVVGLAFSGGGIRSATFCLGVLQGLAELRLLKMFDYLSTVSGGGYIGSWLVAWLKREGNLDTVQDQLTPLRVRQAKGRPDAFKHEERDEEPEPIYHLRAYSNYLTARRGFMSADTWSLLALYFRNLFLNQLVVLPAVACVLFVIIAIWRLFCLQEHWSNLGWYVAAALSVFIWLWSFVHILNGVRAVERSRKRSSALGTLRERLKAFNLKMLAPMFAATIGVALLAAWQVPAELVLSNAFANAALVGAAVAALNLIPYLLCGFWQMLTVEDAEAVGIEPLAWGFVADMICGMLLFGAFHCFWMLPADAAPMMLAVFGPLTTTVILVLRLTLTVALLKRGLSEDTREWLGSLSGRLLCCAAVWTTFTGVAFFGPFVIANAHAISAVLASGWLGVTGLGSLAGWSRQTGGQRKGPLEWFTLAAPHIFFIGLLSGLSFLALFALIGNVESGFTAYCHAMTKIELVKALILVGLAFVLALLASDRIDVNLFSLQSIYANRLVRCYLGASRPKRAEDLEDGGHTRGVPSNSPPPKRIPNAVSGFDPRDDLPLHSLGIERAQANQNTPAQADQASHYPGPYLLINTAMNLVRGQELAWQERMAESFVLSPQYCGSKSTGFRKLDACEPLNLGTAMAISGAAASPNMGYHSSPAVTALLAVLNLRLGSWIGNPGKQDWTTQGPDKGLLYLWRELFGATNARSPYVYLSDGGHFDNLGVYELIRRRCRFIVAVDSAADPDGLFEDLASLIRKVKTDLGIRIDIDLTPLRGVKEGRFATCHCALGTIRYDDFHEGEVPGLLVYIKSSLTGDESSDVLTYADNNPSFPHECTADQFFSESQFESYRALGYHIARDIFSDAALSGTEPVEIFNHLRTQWFAPPPDPPTSYIEAAEGCSEIHRLLASDPNLGNLSREMYPELSSPRNRNTRPRKSVEQARAELHASARIFQVMEDAWLRLRLAQFHGHPLYRGWMNAFRRWTSPKSVQDVWALLRGEYSHGFVQFCERELGLRNRYVKAVQVDPRERNQSVKSAQKELVREFDQEWSGLKVASLKELIKKAGKSGRADQPPPVWFIAAAENDDDDVDWNNPLGVILAVPIDSPPQNEEQEEAAVQTKNEFNLMVWVRPAYRCLGVGRHAMDKGKLLDAVEAALAAAPHPTFRACLPRAAKSGKLKRAMWLRFFSVYAFRRDDSNEADLVMALTR